MMPYPSFVMSSLMRLKSAPVSEIESKSLYIFSKICQENLDEKQLEKPQTLC
jgi:hypothetical protein